MNAKDIIEILRPINCIMGSLTVIIGILNTRTATSLDQLLINIILGIFTYFLLAGAGMVINDIYDVEIDKINRPTRPIPRGSITLNQARLIFIITFAIGIVLSFIHMLLFQLSIFVPLLALIFGFIGWLYAAWGKKQGFLGNIIVSISFSIGLVYGALLNSSSIPNYIYYFFLTSFFLLLAREIVKGCEDIEGDKEEGVKTLAIILGPRKAIIISILSQVAAIVFFILPLFTGIINKFLFFLTMIPGIVIVGTALVFSIKTGLEKSEFKKISLLLKLGAFLGLIAFIFASI